MYCVVGLGNTGEEYVHTRHNVGRMAVSAWVARRGGSFVESSRYHGLIWEGVVASEDVLALLPETFMNQSGGSVARAIISPQGASRLIVLHDDLDLPLGTLRISFARGSGGHNGVRSVSRSVGTGDFVRIRIGISPRVRGVVRKPKGEKAVLAWVMGPFLARERAALSAIQERVGDAIEHIINHGHQSAMNAYNTSPA